uniref:complex I subunit 5 family protein n=1 Tax=Agathobacter sp. TaxID=2021311 RepID=UPI0040568124
MLVNNLIYAMVFMPMAGAFVSYLIGRNSKPGRDFAVSIITILEFICAFLLVADCSAYEGMIVEIPDVCGMGLSFTIDGFRVLYGWIAALMWLMTSLFSTEYFAHYKNRNRYYLFLLLTLGATEAIFLSADLYTTFIFFEIMSVSSYVWVAQDERKPSMRAAETYLAVAIIGGLVMLMGLFLLYKETGTLVISKLHAASQGKQVYPAALCLFIGFGAKAGAFPLHIWLPKAHPVAPAPASALLSGILTKTGIFGILVISCQILLHDSLWGAFMLLIGVVTMFVGAVLAVFSIDFKRTLACSSVSQIGFILVGIGMQGLLAHENALAVRGTFLHMVNHSLFKLVLFMVAGVIYMNLHKLDLNDIRGFGRKKPLLAGIYLMGALGIGGIPLWSGYISKTLLHESIVEYIHGLEHGEFISGLFTVDAMRVIEWVFLISGGLTIAYMCKLFVAVFLEKNNDEEVQKAYDKKTNYMNNQSKFAVGTTSILFLVLGVFPNLIMDNLADMAQGFMGLEYNAHEVHYFIWANLKGSLISIVIGAIVYWLVVRKWMMQKQDDGSVVYINRWPKKMDLEDSLYRPILLKFLPGLFGTVCGVFDILTDAVVVLLRKTVYKDSRPEQELEEGNEVTHAFGTAFNKAEHLLNHTIWREHPYEKDFEHRFALLYSGFKENMGMIGRSLSYGLILFSLGLCGVLIYLLMTAL